LAKYKTKQQEISLLGIAHLENWLLTAKKEFVMVRQYSFALKMRLSKIYLCCGITLTDKLIFNGRKSKVKF